MSPEKRAQLDDAIAAMIESPSEQAIVELGSLLRDDPDAQRYYLEQRDLHAALDWRADADAAHRAAARPAPAKASAGRTDRFKIAPVAYALAAVVALAAAAVAIYLVVIDPISQPRDPNANLPVATLVDASGTVIFDDDIANEGGEYPSGTYATTSGTAQLLLTSRVGVTAQPNTTLAVYGNMAAAMSRGEATFRCPPGAEGFTVHLPDGSRVVDLGTEFTVKIDDDQACVVFVNHGRVELRAASGSNPKLATGDGYRINTDGTVVAMNRRDLLEAFGRDAVTAADYESIVLDDDPVAYWPLAYTNDTAADWAADRDGELSRVSAASQGPAADTKSATFDGTGHIDLGDRTDLVLNGSMTVESWVWIDPTIVQHGRVISFDINGNGGWGLGWSPGDAPGLARGFRFTLLAVKDYDFVAVEAPTRRWAHVAAVVDRDANHVRLYVDGERAQTIPGARPMKAPTSPRVYIGQQAPDFLNFKGRIAHVAVYDHALDDDAVRERASFFQPKTDESTPPIEE